MLATYSASSFSTICRTTSRIECVRRSHDVATPRLYRSGRQGAAVGRTLFRGPVTANRQLLLAVLAHVMDRVHDRRHAYQRVSTQATPSDSKASIFEDYEAYKQYYSLDRIPLRFGLLHFGRVRLILALLVAIILLVLVFHRSSQSVTIPESAPIGLHIRTKTLGATLQCESETMKPSATPPSDVNKVRPADIKVVAAMGDSITVGAYSTNYLDDTEMIFPGNSFSIGGDESLKEHITLPNILRKFNPSLVGMSRGTGSENTGFNVAVSGMTSLDIPRQAQDLVDRMKKKGVSLSDDWKLVTIFIGTNDIGKLRCLPKMMEPTSRVEYKKKIEDGISLLQKHLNRTIISIVSIWNSELVYDAQSLIDTGKRMQCGDDYISKRDALTLEYRKVVYEIQNEKKFERSDFTVVVQGFMDDIHDAFRNQDGKYDKSFYGSDVFHLSKYGNAVMGKFLWNNLLEPVGNKTTKADLGNDSEPLKCPTKASPYIQTAGNRPL